MEASAAPILPAEIRSLTVIRPFRRQRPTNDPHPPAAARSLQAGGHRFDPGWLHRLNGPDDSAQNPSKDGLLREQAVSEQRPPRESGPRLRPPAEVPAAHSPKRSWREAPRWRIHHSGYDAYVTLRSRLAFIRAQAETAEGGPKGALRRHLGELDPHQARMTPR